MSSPKKKKRAAATPVTDVTPEAAQEAAPEGIADDMSEEIPEEPVVELSEPVKSVEPVESDEPVPESEPVVELANLDNPLLIKCLKCGVTFAREVELPKDRKIKCSSCKEEIKVDAGLQGK